MERGGPYLSSSTIIIKIEGFIAKHYRGVVTTPFGRRVTNNIFGGRELNDKRIELAFSIKTLEKLVKFK